MCLLLVCIVEILDCETWRFGDMEFGQAQTSPLVNIGKLFALSLLILTNWTKKALLTDKHSNDLTIL
ncbi:hypothetical protein BofuT4_uP042810.1 [Botrytis cinerea T4]|uniref:Uncharacterized protein n=1 Tax=Botryotinia fuckeliana (strain T4) TaxID=999810 RepID=G2Y1Y0_BOTF4|nr:hypothetical protein BofuT4_uP042810.1 [Botrytis cinerea T4]